MNIIDLRDEPEHIQTLSIWHHKEWAYLNPQGDIQMRIVKMHTYLGQDFLPSTFIAKETGSLLGSVAVVKHDMDSRQELSPWLASVFVAPEYRRKGVGSKLVRHAMEKAISANFSTLYLFTPDKMSFYTALGWEVVEHTLYHDHEVAIMKVDMI